MIRNINLANPAFRPRRVMVSAARLAIVAGLLALGMAAGALFVGNQTKRLQAEVQAQESQLSVARERLAALSKRLAGRQPDAALTRQIQKAEAMLQAKQEAVAALEADAAGGVDGFSGVMRALARQSVDGLWLTGFRLASPGNELTLDGRALDPELLPAYIRRLNAEPVFRGRTFAALRMSVPEVKPGAVDGPQPAQPRFVEFSLASTEPREVKR